MNHSTFLQNEHTHAMPERQSLPPTSEKIHKCIDAILPRLDTSIRWHTAFHTCFLILATAEIAGLCILVPLSFRSATLSFMLAALFLTVFSYFTLRGYFKTRVHEQLAQLVNDFGEDCKKALFEQKFSLARAYTTLADFLKGREASYFRLPQWTGNSASLLEPFSTLCYRSTIDKLRELLLRASVQEHIALVKSHPTHLEHHAGLANAYVILSNLYASSQEEEKFRFAAERAIEEFKILKEFAPDDPWVHLQLAYSYQALNMPKDEIAEYEAVLALCPNDAETLFLLGTLYFKQGFNANGLRAYEQLKKMHSQKAEQVIRYYGAYEHDA